LARARSLQLTLPEARRIALAAQGLGAPRGDGEKAPGRARLLATVQRLGVLQIDAVNVLARAHYVPLFSRLGPYATTLLDDAAYGAKRALFEYWGHQASLLPVAMQPLFRWRMAAAERGEGIYAGLARFARARKKYVASVLAEVRERGPLGAGELSSSTPRKGGWWGWSDAKRALEWLFWAGLVTTATRRSFERVYDVPDRVLPPRTLALPTPGVTDAQRELVRVSAKALGVATEDDLADYFRLRRTDVRPRVRELVEEGALEPVAVDGIELPMFLAAGLEIPSRAEGRAILSPFDPVVWHRARAERLFGFHYRIEIYTPEHLREHGYYVLPFLLGEELAARVDLKAERAASVLLVQAAHAEPGVSSTAVAEQLALELAAVARWLGLAAIRVMPKGRLAKALGAACARIDPPSFA